MNNLWAFAPMRDSSDVLGDSTALRQRLDDDGYLLLKSVVDPDRIREVRRDVVEVLERHGWIKSGFARIFAETLTMPAREDSDRYLAVYDDVQRLESFHTMAHDEELMAVMRDVVGSTAFPHPLKIARIAFPRHPEASTPPHQDYPNNQGTDRLVAAWIPLGECDRELGGLAILRGSQHHGIQPLGGHAGPGNRQALVSPDLVEKCQWVTTDYEAGDVLLFGSMTVHASLHNGSDTRMRLSVDYRYQCEGEPVADHVLQPHFGRLTWDDIYADWSDTSLQYYWRDLDVEVVPFEVDRYPIVDEPENATAWVLRYERRLRARHAPPGADVEPKREPVT